MRNLPPFDFQHSVHRLINALGNIIVTTYLWAILSFVISSVLWFAMVVVIYPEQALWTRWEATCVALNLPRSGVG